MKYLAGFIVGWLAHRGLRWLQDEADLVLKEDFAPVWVRGEREQGRLPLSAAAIPRAVSRDRGSAARVRQHSGGAFDTVRGVRNNVIMMTTREGGER